MKLHIAQFTLEYYKGDSIIQSSIDLNDVYTYCIDDGKVHRKEYSFGKDVPEPFFKEMGNYTDGDCDGDFYYFHTPKDVLIINYNHEIGNFDHTDSNEITKWLDECFSEGDEGGFYNSLPSIYNDVKSDIDEYFKGRDDLCSFKFERLLKIYSNSYTTGYECVEYECSFHYNGLYNLIEPKKLTEDEECKIIHGMDMKAFDDMVNKQYGDMADFFSDEKNN